MDLKMFCIFAFLKSKKKKKKKTRSNTKKMSAMQTLDFSGIGEKLFDVLLLLAAKLNTHYPKEAICQTGSQATK